MKHILLTIIAILTVAATYAEDFSFAFEGGAEKRERLADLQDSETPPTWDLADWENSDALTQESTKGKIVVLDFWATWCGPCIRSISHNNEIYEKYKEDVVFIGVCHPRGSEKMQATVESEGIKYPVAIDADKKTIEAYEVNGFPDYYIFDRTGKLIVADCSNSKVEKVLEKLLAQ